MDDRRVPMQPITISYLISCMSLILMLSASVTHAGTCPNVVDIAIAVDTASSETASNFEVLKTEVKQIVSGFTVGGEQYTRLALISLSQNSRVVVNFNAVNSLSDFYKAVDSLTLSTGIVDLSEGMKVAKNSVLSTARGKPISKVLILVKDRRSGSDAAVSVTAAALSQIASEAAAVRSVGASIQVIGIGGLWNIRELTTLYGTDYVMFKNRNRALEGIKSLNKYACVPKCPNVGTESQVLGYCQGTAKHVIHTKVDLAETAVGKFVCRKTIDRSLAFCTMTDDPFKRCYGMLFSAPKVECRNFEAVTGYTQVKFFDYRKQMCKATTVRHKRTCTKFGPNKVDVDPPQLADVIFMLDRSIPMGRYSAKIKKATELLITSMHITGSSVLVGVMTFGIFPKMIVPLGSSTDKVAMLRVVSALPDIMDDYRHVLRNKEDMHLMGAHIFDIMKDKAAVHTDKALKLARETFKAVGRGHARKVVIIFTNLESKNPAKTFDEIALIKGEGVTIIGIGIGDAKQTELKLMTSPESATNLHVILDSQNLNERINQISKVVFIQTGDKKYAICVGNFFLQSVSECSNGKELISKVRYYGDKKCTKISSATVSHKCGLKCIDPIDGNEYPEGAKWTTLCHDFQCSGSETLVRKQKVRMHVLLKSRCQAADTSCRDVGAEPFACQDDEHDIKNNCRCINDPLGRPTLVIDTDSVILTD